MEKMYPRPTGELQGDDRPMPDRGVNSGVTDTYGGGLEVGYQNPMGIAGDTQSDPEHESDRNRMPDADD